MGKRTREANRQYRERTGQELSSDVIRKYGGGLGHKIAVDASIDILLYVNGRYHHPLPLHSVFGRLIGFDREEMVTMMGNHNGWYCINHAARTGFFATHWSEMAQGMIYRGYARPL